MAVFCIYPNIGTPVVTPVTVQVTSKLLEEGLVPSPQNLVKKIINLGFVENMAPGRDGHGGPIAAAVGPSDGHPPVGAVLRYVCKHGDNGL